MAIVWVPEGQEYSLDDIRKNPNKYQPYANKNKGIDTSYGDMQNDSPEMKFEGFGQNQQQAKSAPEGMLWKGAKEAARIGAGALASGISGLAGVPRNILDAANSAINFTRPEMTEDVRRNLEANPELSSFATGNVIPSEYIPSGEDVKGAISKALPEDYLKSSGQHQDFVNELSSDIGSMLFPLGSATKIGKAFKVAGFGNAAKYLTKNIGGSEGDQNKVKAGVMLLTTLGFGDGLLKKGSDGYKKLEEIVPKTSNIPSHSVRNLIQDQYEWINEGAGDLLKDRALFKGFVDKLKDAASGPTTNIRNLIKFKQQSGQILRESAGDLGKEGWKSAQVQFAKLNSGLNNILKNSPAMPKEGAKLLADVDNIWSNIKQGQKAASWIKSKADVLSKAGGGAAILGKMIGGNFSPIALTATGLGAAGSAASRVAGKAVSFINNFFKHPNVRNEYLKMAAAALKENTPVFLKHANNLGNELKKVNNKPLGEKGKYYPPKDGRMGYYIE